MTTITGRRKKVGVGGGGKYIKCDDCSSWVKEEDTWVWPAPLFFDNFYGSKEEPLYMCEDCRKYFLDHNQDHPEFKERLKRVHDYAREYNRDVVEKLR